MGRKGRKHLQPFRPIQPVPPWLPPGPNCRLRSTEGRLKLIGLALSVPRVLALALGGIRYTTREKVLDLGPIEATTEKHKMIPLSPIVGIAAVVGGIAVLAIGSRTRV